MLCRQLPTKAPQLSNNTTGRHGVPKREITKRENKQKGLVIRELLRSVLYLLQNVIASPNLFLLGQDNRIPV